MDYLAPKTKKNVMQHMSLRISCFKKVAGLILLLLCPSSRANRVYKELFSKVKIKPIDHASVNIY